MHNVSKISHYAVALVASVSILTSPLANGDDAPIAEQPSFEVGDTFVFETNGELNRETYVGLEDGNHIFNRTKTGEPDQRRIFTQNMAAVGHLASDVWIRRFIPHSGWLHFPLKVGAKWKHSYKAVKDDGSSKNRIRKCKVKKYQQNVKVKAGTWNVFMISCRNKWDQARRAAFERYMYAPAVGRIIKYKSLDFDYEFELAEFRPVNQ